MNCFTVLQDMFATGRHFTEMSEGPDNCRSMPLPPMPVQRQPAIIDSDEDFPLPPPPEELLYQSCQESPYQRRSSGTHPVQTDIMQHLNATLVARKSVKQNSDPNRASNWSDKSSGYSASGDADDEDDYSFARQLKGVQLKRAVSHDRSAPRLHKLWVKGSVVFQVSAKLGRMPG